MLVFTVWLVDGFLEINAGVYATEVQFDSELNDVDFVNAEENYFPIPKDGPIVFI